jgi:hypothetical protein
VVVRRFLVCSEFEVAAVLTVRSSSSLHTGTISILDASLFITARAWTGALLRNCDSIAHRILRRRVLEVRSRRLAIVASQAINEGFFLSATLYIHRLKLVTPLDYTELLANI